MENQDKQLADLPENVKQALIRFLASAQESCATNLTSVVLFGSAAEGRLRPTSDVNLMLVLREFQVAQIDGLREHLRLASAAIRLGVMFILADEIPAATEAFAVKFTDILNRHRILFGPDPFVNIEISRLATLNRLKQVVVNLTLRLRERYAMVSLREDRLAVIVAEVAGPLRACAATILRLEGLRLEGGKDLHPKEALQIFTQKIPNREWGGILANISTAREEQLLKPGEATATVLGLLDLLKAMHVYVQGMK